MHQTFYIDLDEEVNSVISRIKKSNSKYNILVIAQGALLMQSSVSLKLIKREADTLEKKVMIVTKDEQAAIIAKKIGFPVKKSLEELGESRSDLLANKENIAVAQRSTQNVESNSPESIHIDNKKNRLTNLGAESFISNSEIIKNQEIREGTMNYLSKNNLSGSQTGVHSLNNKYPEIYAKDSFKDLFTQSVESEEVKGKEKISTNKILKFLWFFVLVIGLLSLGIGAYFFLPSAEVKVFPIKKNNNITLKLDVSENSINSQDDNIALKTKLIEEESVLSLTFSATGQKGDSNQKAKGNITIYNEFSETSQILVATTRFLSNDNKLFRLLETVTVPGMTVIDGKIEAGKVEAAIVADEAGSDFNIKEASFTIPGLKGSPKYDKFYAKLSQETKGGGNSESSLKTVAKSDIESAKFKTENQLKDQLRESVKNKIGGDNLLLDNAIAYEVVDFSIFPEEGSVTESFEYQVKMKTKALIFSTKEMDEKITDFINVNVAQKDIAMELTSFEKNYGNADVDFSKKTIKMTLSVNAKLRSKIDKDKISNSLAGKNKVDMAEIISNYPEISRIEAVISPNFVSNSFPRYPSKIKVEINNE